MSALLKHLSERLRPHLHRDWWLAYSGGLDSSVLLALLVELRHQEPLFARNRLKLVHVDHALHPDSAHWAQWCSARATAYQLAIHSVRVAVDEHFKGGLEAGARAARYAVFKRCLSPGELLLQAHHANDQAETLMLRLMRGAGVNGLRAIPEQRSMADAQLLRPLLNITRAELKAYAHAKQLSWIEDPSNQSLQHDRNFIRQQVMPVLAERWPSYQQSVLKSIHWLQQSHILTTELAQQDLKQCSPQQDGWGGLALQAEVFLSFSIERRHNLMRFWLEKTLGAVFATENLHDLLLGQARRTTFKHRSHSFGCEYFNQKLHLYALPKDNWQQQIKAKNLILTLDTRVELPAIGVLKLTCHKSTDQFDWPLKIAFRRGGERAHPVQREHSQRLKKLFQEYRVPPWWRARVPLLFNTDTLIAVADLWHEKSSAQYQQLKLQWQRENLSTVLARLSQTETTVEE